MLKCYYNIAFLMTKLPTILSQGSSREVKAPEDVSERMLQKLRGRREFTVVVTLKQEHFNSGVILSIHHSEQRYGQSHYKYVLNTMLESSQYPLTTMPEST